MDKFMMAASTLLQPMGRLFGRFGPVISGLRNLPVLVGLLLLSYTSSAEQHGLINLTKKYKKGRWYPSFDFHPDHLQLFTSAASHTQHS